MKRILLVFFCFTALLALSISVSAQPPQKLVQVIITPNHTDWTCNSGDKVTFSIQVMKHQNLLKNVTVDYELGPEVFPNEVKKDVLLKDGKLTLKASMDEPGFLRCRVVAKVDGLKYEGLATVAVDEDKIQPTTKEPKDFDEFWSKAISDARKTPLNPMMTLLPERSTSTNDAYLVSFQNDRHGSRIYGILSVPKKPGKYPAILEVPGAGVRGYNGIHYDPEIITLQIGIHGIPVNMPAGVYSDMANSSLREYWSVNKDNKDVHYYKRVYVGCVRAVDFLYSLPQFDGETIGVNGSSQGGALTIVTAGLDHRIKFLVAIYPALCDFAGYLNGRAGGWPHYFKNTDAKQEEIEALSYFDVVNFAKRIQANGWYSWGFNDVVCPPTSMYSAYNVITAPKELHLFHEAGHWRFPELNIDRIKWMKDKCGK